MQHEPNEKRTASRRPDRVIVRYRRANDARRSLGLTRDVSQSGLFLYANIVHPSGTPVLLSSLADDQERMGVVCHVRDPGPAAGGIGGMGIALSPAAASTDAGNFCLAFRGAPEFLEALSRELGHGVARLTSLSPPAEGSAFRLKIVLPVRGAVLEVDAAVASVTPDGFVARFDPSPLFGRCRI